MYARVHLKMGEKEAMIVPSVSVLQQTGTNERYVLLHENGKAKRVKVQILTRYDDQLEIYSADLKGGEELIFAGQTNLENGDLVEIVFD